MAIIDLLANFDDKKIDSRYRLVLIAAQRARQIMEGSKPVIKSKFVKAPSIALEEVLQGKTEFVTGKEALLAYKEAMVAKSLEARKAREAERQGNEGENKSQKILPAGGNDETAKNLSGPDKAGG